jgi:hypothetical protein
MNRILTVHNAEIKTAAVEIKTLTVTGKQVTLAVFRQLQEAPLINRDGSLRGIPRGTVNYHPDKCGDERPHWHVVWQDGTELLRAAVYRNLEHSYLFERRFSSPAGDAAISMRLIQILESGDKTHLKNLWGKKEQHQHPPFNFLTPEWRCPAIENRLTLAQR